MKAGNILGPTEASARNKGAALPAAAADTGAPQVRALSKKCTRLDALPRDVPTNSYKDYSILGSEQRSRVLEHVTRGPALANLRKGELQRMRTAIRCPPVEFLSMCLVKKFVSSLRRGSVAGQELSPRACVF